MEFVEHSRAYSTSPRRGPGGGMEELCALDRTLAWMRSLLFAVLAGAALSASPASAAQRVLQIGDMARIVDVEEPAISPDGKSIAILTIVADAKRTGDNVTLAVVDAGSGRTHTVTRRGEAAVPRWSPDGSRLAYLARPSAEAPHQLFVRDRNGRTRQLTHARGDVIDAAWRPDGGELAFVAADPATNDIFFYAGNNDYTATSLTAPDHLWVVPAGGGTARRLTHGSWTIAPTDPGGIFSPQISWTSDGKAIAFTRVETTFSGDDEYSTIWQIDVAGGAMRKLTSHPNVELSPSYSPDGSQLVYWYPVDGDFTAQNTVRIVGGGAERALAPAFDRNVAGAQWFADGKHLLICAADGTQNRLWTADLSGAMQPLDLGSLHAVCDPYSSSTFDAGIAASISRDGTIAIVATSATSARELYLLPPGSSAPRQLTHVNDFLHDVGLGAMQELTWNGPDGFHEDGVVTYPPGARAGEKHPVVLLIHGGPGLSNSRDFVWERWPLAQMIASRGYVVLQPNYRGSDNLGNKYMTAIVHDTVVGPSADIIAGLTAARKARRRGRFARRRLGLVVRRRANLVADRTRPPLACGSFGSCRQQRVRRIQSLDVQRARSLSARRDAVWRRRRTDLSRELAHHLLRADHYADAHLGNYARSGRPDHAVVRALPRTHGEPRAGALRRLSGLDARTGRRASDGRAHADLARLARFALAIASTPHPNGRSHAF